MKLELAPLSIQAFDYHLPESSIALHPSPSRDASRLLVSKNGQISHHHFYDILEVLPKNSLLVFNNTRVIPARIHLKKPTGSTIELFLLKPLASQIATQLTMESQHVVEWECLVGNKKRWKEGEILQQGLRIGDEDIQIDLHWIDREKNWVKITWNSSHLFAEILNTFGQIPLPPYLGRDLDEEDQERYQTIFSKELGAVAAPTASLHFTQALLDQIPNKGHQSTFITLHVGAGTFLPVKEENVANHPMHREQLIFSIPMMEAILKHEGPIVPVGTTALRALESLYWSGVYLLEERDIPKEGFVLAKEFAYLPRAKSFTVKESLEKVIAYLRAHGQEQWIAETELLIMPGYELHLCDALITNFHQPKSTLLVLIAALIGDHWKEVYAEAQDQGYRFLSYGDTSLLFKQ
ncbi:S-adenosylmethionine:tRNA ribosyltransferase-isomerase [Aquirufa aurantiipilula]|uniref:S-adenosylmethionine:tRNA ribosyltransferase-isomerase n=1 Tax=Aquirufa aurantiipilula TaxID=2696561 RepID=A0ABT6BMN3_9BACT|nr:S-adenosylmethionine:tRNA ribosyltransferase-isomerase [Aquirufa aurantiipilula]MDF5691734.1 S-adenosylmethionine:tRNA ribosyltransferase-isomerase [Aquirufa aurantiipilula]